MINPLQFIPSAKLLDLEHKRGAIRNEAVDQRYVDWASPAMLVKDPAGHTEQSASEDRFAPAPRQNLMLQISLLVLLVLCFRVCSCRLFLALAREKLEYEGKTNQQSQ
jgi:hypothetical protein